MSASLVRCLAQLVLFSAALVAGCGGDDTETPAGPAPSVVTCPVVVSETTCDKSLRPIVFIHGTLGAGDNAEHIAMLFGSNGYCQERFVAVDYNSLGDSPALLVDALIDKVLRETGQTKVDLMGHSQGGGHGFTYLSDPARAARVANYVHIAGGSEDAPPSGVRTMAITSKADVTGVSTITGAEKNVIFETHDHMGVAMSKEAFVEMYKFLIGKDPQYTEVQCGDEQITLLGKAAAFGSNQPLPGALVEFYELGAEPVTRTKPAVVVTVAADGTVGPTQVRRGVVYEARAVGPDGKVIGHMYYTPWKRSDYLVRALLPSATGITAAITGQIPADDNFSVLIARYNQRAIRADLGDTLAVNGENVLVPELANATTTTVAYFLWDDNKNGVSDKTSPALFNITPFIKAVDVFVPAKPPAFVDVAFNGVVLKIPNWPSASEGPTVIMFQ